MPNFDGTGPYGARTLGRGLGPCGRGLRRGSGLRFRKNPTKEEEKDILESELKELEAEKQLIKERLSKL